MISRIAASLALLATLGCGGERMPPVATPAAGSAQVWLTTADRTHLLARQSDVAFGAPGDDDATRISVDADSLYQEMVGFGAAITDASAWLIQHRLSAAQREALLQDLFGNAGIALSFTRLTVGASDFSRAHYTLDDVAPGAEDRTLVRFSLDPIRADVLPVVRRALAINPRLSVMATPWSAPAWMKEPRSLIGGTLRRDAYPAFAQYLRRYVEAMGEAGVPIAAITLQNEPHHEPPDYPGMRLSPAQRAELLGDHVGPLFERHRVAAVVLEWDHNWDEPESPLSVLGDTAARRYVSGVAWHCYAGDVTAQAAVRAQHPDKDVYFTECSGGSWAPDWGDNLLWNVRSLVIGAPRAWARGVLLWNLALDERHGPHLGGCKDCRGVVTIDSASGAVTRNEEYYALAHASRFVRPGARRVWSSSGMDEVESVAFRNTDGLLVLIVAHGGAAPRAVRVTHHGREGRFSIPARSVVTLTWR